jgi:NAD(P)H dehydrogenase (quinone)
MKGKIMKILIIYCHPSKNSFTEIVKEEFLRGLKQAGHKYVVSDLYNMNFQTDITEEEYLREAFYDQEIPLCNEVIIEQEKIQEADAITFIYPVFWTEAPAKLVGWFDRVWSVGFAYGTNAKMKLLEKALFIAVAGKTLQSLEETGEIQAMKTVMLGDRIRDRATIKEFVILEGTTRWNEIARDENCKKHMDTVFQLGNKF